jgi:hypothetical protein
MEAYISRDTGDETRSTRRCGDEREGRRTERFRPLLRIQARQVLLHLLVESRLGRETVATITGKNGELVSRSSGRHGRRDGGKLVTERVRLSAKKGQRWENERDVGLIEPERGRKNRLTSREIAGARLRFLVSASVWFLTSLRRG